MAVDGWAVTLIQRWRDWAGPQPAQARACPVPSSPYQM